VNFLLEVTVNRSWEGHCNPGLTAEIDSLSNSEITHLLFTRLVDAGFVIITPGFEGEKGAEPWVESGVLEIGEATKKILFLMVKTPKRKRVVTREPKTEERHSPELATIAAANQGAPESK
jgi:hypothetical protein